VGAAECVEWFTGTGSFYRWYRSGTGKKTRGGAGKAPRTGTCISAPVKYYIEPSISLLYFIAFSSSRKRGGIGR